MAKTDNKAPDRRYQVTGLQEADVMEISFGGRTFDLANLSPADAEYLLANPEQVPYLKAVEKAKNSQSND